MAENKSNLPNEPIHYLTKPIVRFLHVEAASGVVLLLFTIITLIIANSSFAESYFAFLKTKIGFSIGDFEFKHSLKHLISDGLMAIFFFVIGLEVKREMVMGELKDFRSAALPLMAAFGGMLAPAGLYLLVLHEGPAMRGWGIPMATDIAFVVGCMALLGKRVPHAFRVFLLSLAIADDIGAILVIAVGYTDSLQLQWLITGFAGLGVILILGKIGVRNFLTYVLFGVFIWFAFHESGVHATIAGVLLGLLTPAKSYVSIPVFEEMLSTATKIMQGDEWDKVPHRAEKLERLRWATRETVAPLEYLETTLHPWVGFVIMPVFAFANAGVPIQLSDLGSPIAIAVMVGLVVGKPLGITLMSFIAVKSGMARLPQGVNWGMIFAGGCLSGIGFTMALFIAGLALSDEFLDTAKIGILAASTISAILGMTLLIQFLPKPTEKVENKKSSANTDST